MAFNFKSSGVKLTDVEQQKEALKQTSLPIGIKTPVEIGTGENEGIFSMHYSLQDQISDNLRNLISTNWGERLGLHDYGANLNQLTTELASSDNFESVAMSRIQTAIKKWMPFVTPMSFTSNIDQMENQNTAVIKITLTYKVPTISEDERKILVTLYAM